MSSSQKVLNTLRYDLGFGNLQDLSQLAQVSQNQLEQKFNATPKGFSATTMGRTYMTWLIHQDFTTEENPQSRVVEQWVSFVDSWGLEVEDAITLWAKISNKDTEPGEDTKQLREKRNALRHEIENQFLKLENSEPRPPSNFVEAVPLRNYQNIKTRGQIKKFDEYAKAMTKAALENWPTKDIPFSSIETAAGTDRESKESEETTSPNIKREHGEAPAKRKAKLDTGSSSSPRLVLKGSGTISSPIDLTK